MSIVLIQTFTNINELITYLPKRDKFDVRLTTRKWENYLFIIMRNWKHAHSDFIKKNQQYNIYFRITTNVDQYLNTSKIILTLQAQVPPKPHLYIKNLKLIQSNLLTYMTTSILGTIKMTPITFSMHIRE